MKKKIKLEEYNLNLDDNIKNKFNFHNNDNIIYESIDFLKASNDSLKTKFSFYDKDTEKYNKFVKEEYSNKYLKEKSNRGYLIDQYMHKLTKILSTSKSSKFNVISLISDGEIDKITF